MNRTIHNSLIKLDNNSDINYNIITNFINTKRSLLILIYFF